MSNLFKSCFVLSAAALSGCVSEALPSRKLSTAPRLAWETHVVHSGTYHGVNILLEIEPHDADGAAGPPGYARALVPQFVEGKEYYRHRDVHEIVYFNGMFHVGDARYEPQQRATLHVFKKRSGEFRFAFRGHEVVVHATRPWVPSIYYTFAPAASETQAPPERESARRRRSAAAALTKEIVRIGHHRIESDPRREGWIVNGKPYFPSRGQVLELRAMTPRNSAPR